MTPGTSQLVLIIVLFGAFYFLAIRPQQQRQKQQQAMIAALVVGDEVVTVGGIYGTVVDLGERVTLRVLDGSRIEVAKQAIAQKLPARVADDTEAVAGSDAVVATAPVGEEEEPRTDA